MAQWWEHLPLTNVARVRFPDSASYVGWVCWFSILHREVFSGHSGFPSPQKPTFDFIYFHCSFQFTVSPISAPALERLDTYIMFLSFPFLSYHNSLCSSRTESTSQLFFFLLPWKHVKRSAFQNKQLAISQMAFRARKIFRIFEKRAPEVRTGLEPGATACKPNAVVNRPRCLP